MFGDWRTLFARIAKFTTLQSVSGNEKRRRSAKCCGCEDEREKETYQCSKNFLKQRNQETTGVKEGDGEEIKFEFDHFFLVCCRVGFVPDVCVDIFFLYFPCSF